MPMAGHGYFVGHEAAVAIRPQEFVDNFRRMLVGRTNMYRVIEPIRFFGQTACKMLPGTIAGRTQYVKIDPGHCVFEQVTADLFDIVSGQGTSTPQYELGQHGDWPSRAAFLAARAPRCSGDVQMRPLHIFGELTQEAGRCNRTAFTFANIREIGKIAPQLGFIFFSHRHRPATVISRNTAVANFGLQIVVVAHNGCAMMTQCDDTGAGECCDVNDRVRFEAP